MATVVSGFRGLLSKFELTLTNLATDQDIVEHVAVVKDWTPAEERALVRKLDMRVLFPCCILYFLAYLDRANNAETKASTPNCQTTIPWTVFLFDTSSYFTAHMIYVGAGCAGLP